MNIEGQSSGQTQIQKVQYSGIDSQMTNIHLQIIRVSEIQKDRALNTGITLNIQQIDKPQQSDEKVVNQFMIQYQNDYLDQINSHQYRFQSQKQNNVGSRKQSIQSDQQNSEQNRSHEHTIFTFGKRKISLEVQNEVDGNIYIPNQQRNSKNQKKNNKLEQQNQQNIGQHIIKSIKYFYGILRTIVLDIAIYSFVIISVQVIQIKYEISQKCDLKELFEKSKDRNKSIDNRCPLSSYLLANIRNIIVSYFQQLVGYLLIMNIYQFKYRKLVQYGVNVLILIQVFKGCIFQTINYIDIVNESTIVFLTIIIIYNFIRRHNIGVMFQRLTIVIIYSAMVFIMISLSRQTRDDRDVYLIIVLQYLSLLLKSLTLKLLRYKIRFKLWHDDINICYLMILIQEYVFNESYFEQIMAIFNFIVNQIWNISNVNIFYEVYKCFYNLGIIVFQRQQSMYYLILVCLLILEFVRSYIAQLYIYLAMSVILKYLYKQLFSDNQMAVNKELQAIQSNGYHDYQIEEHEINDLKCQQSVIGYINFIVYQILLLIVYIAFPPNHSVSSQYQLIHQFGLKNNEKLTLPNLLIFNILLFILVFVLIIKKSYKQLKIVRQATKSQSLLPQYILMIGFIFEFNKRLFETNYMKQSMQV